MHSESNKDISLCSNFFAVFFKIGFLAHQETKDSYDFVIAMNGSRIVSQTRDSPGAHSGSTCNLHT